MPAIRTKRVAALALAACMVFAFGCIFGNDDDDNKPTPVPDFKALTDKENVIYNLVQSYAKADITHYDELLHADYLWYFNPSDVVMGGLDTFWTRAQDVAATTNIFKAAKGQAVDPDMNITNLDLAIASSSWASVDSIDGSPCDDCWETTREYSLTLVMQSSDVHVASGLVMFIVVPVDDGGTKLYKLWRADDLPK